MRGEGFSLVGGGEIFIFVFGLFFSVAALTAIFPIPMHIIVICTIGLFFCFVFYFIYNNPILCSIIIAANATTTTNADTINP